eukprot:4198936-Prymnesium_polylepis.1
MVCKCGVLPSNVEVAVVIELGDGGALANELIAVWAVGPIAAVVVDAQLCACLHILGCDDTHENVSRV